MKKKMKKKKKTVEQNTAPSTKITKQIIDKYILFFYHNAKDLWVAERNEMKEIFFFSFCNGQKMKFINT